MGFASPGVNIPLATLGKLSRFLLIFNDILYAFIICLNWVAQLYVFCQADIGATVESEQITFNDSYLYFYMVLICHLSSGLLRNKQDTSLNTRHVYA